MALDENARVEAESRVHLVRAAHSEAAARRHTGRARVFGRNASEKLDDLVLIDKGTPRSANANASTSSSSGKALSRLRNPCSQTRDTGVSPLVSFEEFPPSQALVVLLAAADAGHLQLQSNALNGGGIAGQVLSAYVRDLRRGSYELQRAQAQVQMHGAGVLNRERHRLSARAHHAREVHIGAVLRMLQYAHAVAPEAVLTPLLQART